jgi:carbon monoxide dehydrogenase subunit G
MRVAESITISAPAEQVWAIVSDSECVLEFMSGVTRWEVVSPNPIGLGAHYRVLFRIGSAEIGGLIEVVEGAPACDWPGPR